MTNFCHPRRAGRQTAVAGAKQVAGRARHRLCPLPRPQLPWQGVLLAPPFGSQHQGALSVSAARRATGRKRCSCRCAAASWAAVRGCCAKIAGAVSDIQHSSSRGTSPLSVASGCATPARRSLALLHQSTLKGVRVLDGCFVAPCLLWYCRSLLQGLLKHRMHPLPGGCRRA